MGIWIEFVNHTNVWIFKINVSMEIKIAFPRMEVLT
jgi:hypothetical protein